MEKAEDMLFFPFGGFFHFMSWVKLYLRTKESARALSLHRAASLYQSFSTLTVFVLCYNSPFTKSTYICIYFYFAVSTRCWFWVMVTCFVGRHMKSNPRFPFSSFQKVNRRLHLSKTKHSKFNESGQLAAFYLFSFIWGCSILTAVLEPGHSEPLCCRMH